MPSLSGKGWSAPSTTWAIWKIVLIITPAVTWSIENPIKTCHHLKSVIIIGSPIRIKKYIVLEPINFINSFFGLWFCALVMPDLLNSINWKISVISLDKVISP